MAAHRRCSARSAAISALACSLASWVSFATTFVSSGLGQPRGLRGSGDAGRQVSYQTFGAEEPRPETMHWASWVPAAAFALAFGLSMVSTPVHAEDNVQINVLSKEERLVKEKLQMIQESNNLAPDSIKGRGEEGNEGTVVGKRKKSSRTKVKAPSREEAAVSATPAKSTPAPKEIEVPKKKDNTGPKGNEGLWDVLTDQRASYALGIPWLTWNAVYIGLALFSAGSIVAFPVLYSVLLPPPSTVDDMVD